MSSCFICLEPCSSRVCVVCECFAHPKCWGKFIHHSTDVFAYITSEAFLIFTPYNVACPICKSDIMSVKPTTRRDTYGLREFHMVCFHDNLLDAMDAVDCDEDKLKLCTALFRFMVDNKALARTSKIVSAAAKATLEELHGGGWDAANVYHYQLFGTQLSSLCDDSTIH